MKPWPALAGLGKTLSLPGGDLFFYDSDALDAKSTNAAKPVVFLIHGLGDEADSWRHIFPLLAAQGYRVIAPDLPGFGRSVSRNASRWKGNMSIVSHARAVVCLMRETGVNAQNPAALAGSSMGAVVAQFAAFKKPELVKSLILIDGCYPLTGGTGGGLFLMGLPFIGKKWYRAYRKNHEGAWKSLYAYYRDLEAMSGADKDFLRARVIDRVESPSQEHAYFASLRSMNFLSLFARAWVSGRIKKYHGKLFLVWGNADKIIPLDKTAAFRAIRPDTELRLITGAGHLPHQEAPEETAVAITDFLKK